MSTESSLTQQDIYETLTYHYIEENYKDYFPFVLSNLCFQFLNEYEILEIPKNYLHSLSNGDADKIKQLPNLSQTYKLNDDIIFELDTSNWISSLCVRLTSIKLPQNAQYIRVLVKINCKQTNYQYIQTHKYANNGRPIHYLFEIYPNECKKLNELDCELHLDLIEIKYENKLEITGFYSKQIKMKKHYNFEFEISKEILDKHKIRRYINKFYSDSIDDIWCISSHSGRMTAFLEFSDIFDILCLRLRLLILPFGIRAIKIKHSIKCLNDEKIKQRKGIRVFKYDNMLFEYYHPKEFYHYKDFYIPLELVTKTLLFNVDIQIIQIKDMRGNIIPKEDWNKYNIV